MEPEVVKNRMAQGRQMEELEGGRSSQAKDPSDQSFSLIDTIQGTWSSADRGWNLIALPFKHDSAQFNYRLLMNQYGEELKLKFADRNIPNRGITEDSSGMTDQLIDGIDYQQVITQVAAEDSPSSGMVASNGSGIHHEPGLVLQILNHHSKNDSGQDLTVARLATIPHGDSVLAMGTVEVSDGPPIIPDLNALPIRVNQDINSPYLQPYKHFEDNKFVGTVPTTVPGFPGFFSTNANAILQFANPGSRVKRTTTLHFDTKFGTGGIVNIPFVVKEANAVEMEATFWIMEVESEDSPGDTEIVMQYSQTVMLDFFESRQEPGSLIRWPHVSINTLTRSFT